MVHRYHPDPERRESISILYDDCERCAEQAESLGLELDAEKFARAWAQMREAEYGDVNTYSTEAEAKLGKSLYRVSVLIERHRGILIGGE